jgi:hypothetical protein
MIRILRSMVEPDRVQRKLGRRVPRQSGSFDHIVKRSLGIVSDMQGSVFNAGPTSPGNDIPHAAGGLFYHWGLNNDATTVTLRGPACELALRAPSDAPVTWPACRADSYQQLRNPSKEIRFQTRAVTILRSLPGPEDRPT